MPDGWRSTTLADVLTEMKNGSTVEQSIVGPGLPMTRIETIVDGRIDYERVRYATVPEEQLRDYRLIPGDVLLSHINSVSHIGKVARYEGARPLFHGMNLMRLRFNDQLIDPLFGFLVLRSHASKAFFERRCKKAVSQASLNRADIGSLQFLLPPLPEQRRIAAILTSMDDAIAATQAVIDQLRVVKKALLEVLLTRGLPGRHTRFKQTEIGEVPAEWDVRPLEALIAADTTITYGIVQAGPHVAGGVPYIRTGDVKPGGIDLRSLGRTAPDIAAHFKRSEVRQGDLVFCIRASVGAVALVPPELDGANLTQGTARISPGPMLSSHYLLWALRSESVQRWIALQCKGSTFREITLAKLRKAPIPLPSKDEQQSITGVLMAVDARKSAETVCESQLASAKAALAQKLLAGELRVSAEAA